MLSFTFEIFNEILSPIGDTCVSTIDFNGFKLTHWAVIIIFRPNALAYFAVAKKLRFMAFTQVKV
jgi:hypothetical protein